MCRWPGIPLSSAVPSALKLIQRVNFYYNLYIKNIFYIRKPGTRYSPLGSTHTGIAVNNECSQLRGLAPNHLQTRKKKSRGLVDRTLLLIVEVVRGRLDWIDSRMRGT